jgi:hypothetical protein
MTISERNTLRSLAKAIIDLAGGCGDNCEQDRGYDIADRLHRLANGQPVTPIEPHFANGGVLRTATTANHMLRSPELLPKARGSNLTATATTATGTATDSVVFPEQNAYCYGPATKVPLLPANCPLYMWAVVAVVPLGVATGALTWTTGVYFTRVSRIVGGFCVGPLSLRTLVRVRVSPFSVKVFSSKLP